LEYDCLFLGMRFLELEIPKEKRFLLKYFTTSIQNTFIKYLIFFGDSENFCDHTGFRCQKRWLNDLTERYNDLIYLYDKAKKDMDLELLTKLDSGKLALDKKQCRYIIK